MFQLQKCVLVLAACLLSVSAGAYTLEELPIQDGGRQKPFLTYAQELLRTLHGSTTLKKGPESKKDMAKEAVQVVATWFLMPELWDESAFIVMEHHGLKKSMGYAKARKYFSFKELTSHKRMNTLFSDLESRLNKKEKLDPYYQAVQRLRLQIDTYLNFRQGGTRVMPAEDGKERNGTWLAVAELSEGQQKVFQEIMGQYILTFVGSDASAQKAAQGGLDKALATFTSMAAAVKGATYPSEETMSTEVFYQKFHPFLWTWVLYILGAIFIGLSGLFLTRAFMTLGLFMGVAAFALHTVGFALRMIITHRPPVTNMYETVIWVAWGCMLFAGIFYLLKRQKLVLVAGMVVSTVCMIIADRAPVILDPTLKPLEPVLRSNMWLIIHVMTITLSYAAFFLAMGVADYGLYLWIRDDKKFKKEIRGLAQNCYHLIQVGVVLLTAGTILGGVWADYSWGRFWGWDPKETWAFIALMGYLALLHARLTGWVKDFGMLAGSVVAFSLVIMAWYGVNYVLGAGLHSYGFGAGGIEYVLSFVGAHFVLVLYSGFLKKNPLARKTS